MTDHEDLIRALLDTPTHPYPLRHDAAVVIKELAAERDRVNEGWRETVMDAECAEDALERSERLRQIWRGRAEKAEDEIAAMRPVVDAAVEWSKASFCGNDDTDQEVLRDAVRVYEAKMKEVGDA